MLPLIDKKMKHQHRFILIIILTFTSILVLAQENIEYESEEAKVISHFLYKLSDAERLSKFNDTEKPLILYFYTGLGCNLDNSYKGEYRCNRLLKELENRKQGRRFIDSTKIEVLNDIDIIFGRKDMYTKGNYESKRVIGTISFSKVSLNKSFTKGYFYYDVYCGEDCGHGGLIRIKKKKGTWIINNYISMWIS